MPFNAWQCLLLWLYKYEHVLVNHCVQARSHVTYDRLLCTPAFNFDRRHQPLALLLRRGHGDSGEKLFMVLLDPIGMEGQSLSQWAIQMGSGGGGVRGTVMVHPVTTLPRLRNSTRKHGCPALEL
jgi:hypothetical protein